jgi:hypothetical protein
LLFSDHGPVDLQKHALALMEPMVLRGEVLAEDFACIAPSRHRAAAARRAEGGDARRMHEASSVTG